MTGTFEAASGSFSDLEVISELGRSAETVVYRVRRGGRDYTLKLLTGLSADERGLTVIRREAALLGCVDHPNLPRIFEVGASASGPYLVLEYIDGHPLSELIRARPLDEATALRLVADVVPPLAAAHRAGLVHRDVKPDNIIVGPDGTARLIDFGLVRRHGPQDGRAGTLRYSAPEQTGMLRRPVDGRSDLYALGVVLFESVTGWMPYHSLDADELARMHARAPIPDPRSVRTELSPPFAALIMRLMAKDPDDRYPSGEALLADLRRLRVADPAVFDAPAAPAARGGSAVGRLVGRDRELSGLVNRWRQVRSGRGGAAIVEGPAGAGKSRLVRELTTAVASEGGLVLYGKCLPDDPVPLAPLRAAVERHLRILERLAPFEREQAVQRLRRAAGRGGPLLRTLSPLLADLVYAPQVGEMDHHHEQFINAVAAFLLGLGDEFQGAILHIDDVHWLDDSTRRVLQQMINRLPGTPLLVLATSRDDTDNLAALARFAADMDATLDTRILLRPLDRDAVIQLVASQLSGLGLSDEEVEELAVRAGGNPFTVGEYVHAVIDAGLITPSWGTWRLDLAGLDQLDLSDDAVDLVLQRIDGLSADSRQVLTAGAATGRRFQADLVAAVCGIEPTRARAILAEAESRRLVTASGGEGYRFLHDRIREALLAGLTPATLRRLHQLIAEVLEARAGDPGSVYLAARHYALGEAERTPGKVYESNLGAGRLALADHAPAEARDFLLVAAAAAGAARLRPATDFHVALGLSCARTGRFGEALSHLDEALRAEPDQLRRAGVLAQVALVHTSAWNPDLALEAVREGLAALGRPLPRGRLGLAVTTLASFALGLAVGRTRIGFGTAGGRRRDRYRLQAVLYDAGAYASSLRMRRSLRVLMSLRAVHPANRLGPGREYARHMAGLGVIADAARRPRLADRLYDRAARVAADLGDPALVGYVEWKRGAGSHLGGRDDGQIWMTALTEHDRWLELGDYLTGVAAVCAQLIKRGRTNDAEAWYARGKARLSSGAEAEGAAFSAVAAAIAAQRGRAEEATGWVEALRRFLAADLDNPTQMINLYAAHITVLVELGEIGEPFERLTAAFGSLGMKPGSILPEQRMYYVYETLGRLAQCHQSSPERQAACRAAAEQAVARLRKAADTKPLRAFHRVARADLEVLAGRPRAAIRALAAAELELLPLDAPLIAYESALVRARALRAMDEPAQARTHARFALMLAVDQQWPRRVQWIRGEFGVGEHTSVNPTGSTGASSHRTSSEPNMIMLAGGHRA
ncbi:AAA family ATPase [Micromonospora chersina]|uniref:serine/threonine-protein kinase n=1 Tax=Micromonospora chersina TaxID=47854 RepID=UPI0033CA395A